MDALPTVVPFFGVIMVTMCGGLTCLSRRLTALTWRVETLEREPPQVIGAPKPPQPPQPTWIPPPQPTWPAYMTPSYQAAPPVAYPYPTAPPQPQLR
jgi:hypothetical protein